MHGTCSVCSESFELVMHERQLVVEPHHDRDDHFCDGSHEPPVKETAQLPD